KASRIVSEAEEEIAAQEKNAQLAVGELVSLQEFMSRSLETETDQEILSLKKQVSDQVERVGELYSDADRKFPVLELPEMVVNCGERVNEVIETELSVAVVPSFGKDEVVMEEGEEVAEFGARDVQSCAKVEEPWEIGESCAAEMAVTEEQSCAAEMAVTDDAWEEKSCAAEMAVTEEQSCAAEMAVTDDAWEEKSCAAEMAVTEDAREEKSCAAEMAATDDAWEEKSCAAEMAVTEEQSCAAEMAVTDD
ncbi:hypothetical protein GBAR_LOCUS26974, partial [Geodia barretti]